MKIIVDANIVFSGILNSSGNIGRLLIHSKGILEFYSSEYLLVEIESHFPKLLKLTDLGSDELSELIATVTRDITFLSDSFLSKSALKSAYDIVKDIDADDLLFVAMANSVPDAKLWTGDKKLHGGLLKKGVSNVMTTANLLTYLNKRSAE
ncbi:MAG: PIN domain-containing protein [Imperialibacter sp.]|uniref:PIN domain-containing protein n=1 Tax=Imperialibacter sp. TaxID=2038411 RepID=UPI0032ED2CA7